MSRPQPVRVSRRRLSATARALYGAGFAAFLALALLVTHIFLTAASLQIAAIVVLGGALLSFWAAIICWRIPIYQPRQLAGLAFIWFAGIALAIALAWIASRSAASVLWRLSVQWLAMTLSLAVGALFLRALLRVRTSPLAGRLLSLISPLGILTLILLLGHSAT